ncbi:ThiF family adenylyltransferase [Aliarcobacter butzleri]
MSYDGLFYNLLLPIPIRFKKETDSCYILQLTNKIGFSWEISVKFLGNFPHYLPMAFLLNNEFIGRVAHVREDGLICLEESDSIIINYNQPLSVLTLFIMEIYNLLERSKLLIAQTELKDEFEGYFSNNLQFVHSFYDARDKIEIVGLRIIKKDFSNVSQPIIIYNKDEGLMKKYSDLGQINQTLINILHIPLEFAILPPSKDEMQDLYEYTKKLFNRISPEHEEFIKKFLNQKKSLQFNFYILFSMPRSDYERTQFLAHFYFKEKVNHPLKDVSTQFEVRFYFLNRNNETYLKERGGSHQNLSGKKVSIVGCGSIGGEIAMMLAKSGVGELTLIDKDMLSQDNIFRHRLGGSSLTYLPAKDLKLSNKSKVLLLKSLIDKDVPYIKVNTKINYFQELLEDKKLLNSDVVIVAVGSPMQSLDINLKLKEIGLYNVIFCWNEADSVGGHSIALNLQKSCYECLYTNDNGFSLNNELSYVEIGQNISKNITGCAGVFMAFSYLDSSQTALMASKQCIEMLLSKNIDSYALSWKTSSNTQLKVTDRFNKSNLQEKINLKQKSKCRVCNV